MQPRFNQAVIHVSDWARSNAVCRDVPGAEVLGDAPDGPSPYRFGSNQPVARQGPAGDPTSVNLRDPDGSLLEFISYA